MIQLLIQVLIQTMTTTDQTNSPTTDPTTDPTNDLLATNDSTTDPTPVPTNDPTDELNRPSSAGPGSRGELLGDLQVHRAGHGDQGLGPRNAGPYRVTQVRWAHTHTYISRADINLNHGRTYTNGTPFQVLVLYYLQSPKGTRRRVQ
jgi:hypothetical protein